jgi:hypothetical protein
VEYTRNLALCFVAHFTYFITKIVCPFWISCVCPTVLFLCHLSEFHEDLNWSEQRKKVLNKNLLLCLVLFIYFNYILSQILHCLAKFLTTVSTKVIAIIINGSSRRMKHVRRVWHVASAVSLCFSLETPSFTLQSFKLLCKPSAPDQWWQNYRSVPQTIAVDLYPFQFIINNSTTYSCVS